MGEKERKIIDLFKSSLSETEWKRLCKHYSSRNSATIIKYIYATGKCTENTDRRALKRALQNAMQTTENTTNQKK